MSIDPHMMIDLAGNSDYADELDRHQSDDGRVVGLRVIWEKKMNLLLPLKPMAKARNGGRCECGV